MITINDGFDIYLKGAMNNWTHNYADEWRMTQNSENEMLYEITVEFTAGQDFGFAQYNKGEERVRTLRRAFREHTASSMTQRKIPSTSTK